MIRSIEDAWAWYEAVRMMARDMIRLARNWETPEFQGVVGRDNHLRERNAAELMDRAHAVLEDLNDLAVLLMFSVFEAAVRDRAGAAIDRETALIQHPAVLRAIKDLRDAIENGGFGKVTESYKAMDVDLTAQVNQVRKFRNWVAHGRRGEPENRVDPESAAGRLRQYLARLDEVEKAATTGVLTLLPPPGPESTGPPDAEPSVHPSSGG